MAKYSETLLKKINEGRKEYKDIYSFTKDVKLAHVKINAMFNNFFDSANQVSKEDRIAIDKICEEIEKGFRTLRSRLLNTANRP